MTTPREALRWMWSLWHPWRWMLLPIVLLTLLNAAAVVAIPLAVKGIFDALAAARDSVGHAILVLGAAGVGRFIAYCALQNCRAWMNCRLEWSIRDRVFSHLMRLGPTFYGRFSVGDLLTRLSSDLGDERLSWFLCSGAFRMLEAVTVVAASLFVMARLDAGLTLAVTALLAVLCAVFIGGSSWMAARYGAVQQAISDVNAQLESSFNGIRVVKTFGIEPARRDDFAGSLAVRRGVEFDAARGQALMEFLYGNAWQLVAGLVMLLGGVAVIQHRMTIGDYVAFQGFAFALTFPMFDIGEFIVKGRGSLVWIERLREIETFPPDVADGGGASDGADLALEGVTFTYPTRQRPALSDLSLPLAPGAFVAITGRVGVGKTTVLRLLLRLVDPDSGLVKRGDRDVRALRLDDVRRGVGYVPQEAVVFSTTVEENVRFGRPEVTDEDVRQALQTARLWDDVAAFEDGLKTLVGARGTRLSGGQKQRLSLARALAGRPRVLLLDDCTAALDAATEAALWDSLRAALPGVTVLYVTHRAAALEKADHVLVLEQP